MGFPVFAPGMDMWVGELASLRAMSRSDSAPPEPAISNRRSCSAWRVTASLGIAAALHAAALGYLRGLGSERSDRPRDSEPPDAGFIHLVDLAPEHWPVSNDPGVLRPVPDSGVPARNASESDEHTPVLVTPAIIGPPEPRHGPRPGAADATRPATPLPSISTGSTQVDDAAEREPSMATPGTKGPSFTISPRQVVTGRDRASPVRKAPAPHIATQPRQGTHARAPGPAVDIISRVAGDAGGVDAQVHRWLTEHGFVRQRDAGYLRVLSNAKSGVDELRMHIHRDGHHEFEIPLKAQFGADAERSAGVDQAVRAHGVEANVDIAHVPGDIFIPVISLPSPLNLTRKQRKRRAGQAPSQRRLLEETALIRPILRLQHAIAAWARAHVEQSTRLKRIWANPDISPTNKRELILNLWRDCPRPVDSSDPMPAAPVAHFELEILQADLRADLARAQAKCRNLIELFVRLRMPQDHPSGFARAELDEINASRPGWDKFAPYALSASGVPP